MTRTVFLSLFLGACGSSAPVSEAVVPPTTGDEAESGPPTWDALRGEALRDYVRDAAYAKLASLDPAISTADVESWLAQPDGAPALSGRATERLLELGAVATAAGDLRRAEKLVRLVRAKARNRNSAFAGNTLLCELARRRAGEDPEAQTQAVASVLRELPRTRLGGATVIFQLYQRPEQLSATLEQIQGQLVSLETASAALFFAQLLPEIVARRDVFLGAIASMSEALAAEPEAEPYAFSTVDLSDTPGAEEVRVAVWDTGVNISLFEDQLYTHEGESVDGEDDDEDGLVDNRHGVVQDVGEHTHAELLFQPSEVVIREYAPFLRGIMDLRAGIADSEAAQRVLALMRSVTDREELEELEQNLDAVGEWAHGTHVAGILLAGIPQARMAVFRSAWAGEARLYHHRGPTDAELAAERENVEHIAQFINTHGIQVVNASLGFSREYVEDALRHEQDRYPTDEAVRARARTVHAHRAATWAQVFAACPDTLFVVAAGNSNQDVKEYELVPASLEAPNLLVVGAVDRFGQWATFTNSNPTKVRVFDFGVAVPSVIPDGTTIPLSGTSMASPNVANLAAKMLAVNPALTPAEVIQLIEETGTPIAEPFGGRIAHEAGAIAAAREPRHH